MDTRHLAWLNQMTDNQIIVLYGPVQQNVDDVCDLALETALSKMLLSSKLSVVDLLFSQHAEGRGGVRYRQLISINCH